MDGFGPRCGPLGIDIGLIVRTKRAGEALLGELVGIIAKHLTKTGPIAGVGILRVKNRADRMGRNPATGEPIQIKASKKVAFRAAKDLKMAV
jgi:DNA-binding protein HU-beta